MTQLSLSSKDKEDRKNLTQYTASDVMIRPLRRFPVFPVGTAAIEG